MHVPVTPEHRTMAQRPPLLVSEPHESGDIPGSLLEPPRRPVSRLTRAIACAVGQPCFLRCPRAVSCLDPVGFGMTPEPRAAVDSNFNFLQAVAKLSHVASLMGSI